MMKRLLLLFVLFCGVGSCVDVALGTTSPCLWAGNFTRCYALTGMEMHDNKSIRFMETTANGSNYVEIKAPASLSGDVTYTLPTTSGTPVMDAATVPPTLTNTAGGAWTLGPLITNNVNGQRHVISGSLNAGNVTATTNSGYFALISNARASGSNALDARTNSTTGGSGIGLSNSTSATGSAIEMFVNQPGDTTGTNGDVALTIDHNGRVFTPFGIKSSERIEVEGATNSGTFIGIYETNALAATTCTTQCNTNATTNGLASGTGACLAAFTASAVTTCADAAGTRFCLCAGVD